MADTNCSVAETPEAVAVPVVTILSIYTVLALLLVGCFLWRVGRRHLSLKDQSIKPIGYGCTKKHKQEIQDRLRYIAKLKPDPRHLYQQQPGEQEDENFFRRQILLDSAQFVYDLQKLCSEVDPSLPLQDCLQCVYQKGMCSRKTLDVNSRATDLYRKARFQAGPVTEGDYGMFKQSLGNLQRIILQAEEKTSFV